MYKNIQTIRYMGNKSKLLDFVVPSIEKITKPDELVCDIMSGTNSVSYALKERNIIVSNDMQYYSYVIACALLKNYKIPKKEEIIFDLKNNIEKNINFKHYSFFETNYSDTYFSKKQCIEIDSIRFAIAQVSDNNKKNLYLTMLMNAMCKAQSTTGHFAQYLPSTNKRTICLREMSIIDLFYEKINDFNDFCLSKYENYCFNLDYNDLFKEKIIKKVKCFYLDSPYTTDQYSRFYHILETVCKYDNPTLNFKAKYRNGRFQSKFCYKKYVSNEFRKIIKFTYNNNSNLVISYSDHGVISSEELLEICREFYSNVEYKELEYFHSSQGAGKIKIKELLYILVKE